MTTPSSPSWSVRNSTAPRSQQAADTPFTCSTVPVRAVISSTVTDPVTRAMRPAESRTPRPRPSTPQSRIPLAEASLDAPLPRPGKIIGAPRDVVQGLRDGHPVGAPDAATADRTVPAGWCRATSSGASVK
ncbi:hypothetical protein ACF07W_24370 [Streptomyces sp. NPDC015140]|uniref:hypothetical protein n=1 Tax=Streptomyces sp. NPDC015140 TaxID=3364943 RepID=UPI0036FE7B62